ncbi:uncharacterized protein LOC141525843 isoform X2 [Cotesia typhae]|uniref:uncharacterized protein LOC141525843 isoform X2 n=1 Tax=Cotesia typhae TaxID=2053667 RepID=UPI003D692A4C
MYAAAGGTSIANRRKQKQISKQRPSQILNDLKTLRGRYIAESGLSIPKNARSHTLAQQNLVVSQQSYHSAPSSTFYNSSQVNHRNHTHNLHYFKRRRLIVEKVKLHRHLAPPLSPIQFFISPPPLSLESTTSTMHPLKFNNFPFPPPSFFDLRISSSTSEIQCGGQGPGKAAWQSCSQQSPIPLSPSSLHDSKGECYKTKQCEAHRRWIKRNKIRDANYCYESNGESNDNDDFSGYRHPEINAALNTVLYVGLGTTALGLVICFIDSLKTNQPLPSSKQEQPTTSLLPRSTDQLIKKTIATRTSDAPSLSTSFEPGKGHELLLVPSQLLK